MWTNINVRFQTTYGKTRWTMVVWSVFDLNSTWRFGILHRLHFCTNQHDRFKWQCGSLCTHANIPSFECYFDRQPSLSRICKSIKIIVSKFFKIVLMSKTACWLSILVAAGTSAPIYGAKVSRCRHLRARADKTISLKLKCCCIYQIPNYSHDMTYTVFRCQMGNINRQRVAAKCWR